MPHPHSSAQDVSTIFVALLGEGTQCWRPVSAAHIRDEIFQILGEPSGDEHWEFGTGELVQCKHQTLSDTQEVPVAFQKATL